MSQSSLSSSSSLHKLVLEYISTHGGKLPSMEEFNIIASIHIPPVTDPMYDSIYSNSIASLREIIRDFTAAYKAHSAYMSTPAHEANPDGVPKEVRSDDTSYVVVAKSSSINPPISPSSATSIGLPLVATSSPSDLTSTAAAIGLTLTTPPSLHSKCPTESLINAVVEMEATKLVLLQSRTGRNTLASLIIRTLEWKHTCDKDTVLMSDKKAASAFKGVVAYLEFEKKSLISEPVSVTVRVTRRDEICKNLRIVIEAIIMSEYRNGGGVGNRSDDASIRLYALQKLLRDSEKTALLVAAATASSAVTILLKPAAIVTPPPA